MNVVAGEKLDEVWEKELALVNIEDPIPQKELKNV